MWPKLNALSRNIRILFMEPTQAHSNTSVDTNRWVVNISQAELSVLKKGLNGVVTLDTEIPVDESIAGTELATQHLDQQTAAQLRSEVVRSLRQAKLPKPNVTNAERDRAYTKPPEDRYRNNDPAS